MCTLCLPALKAFLAGIVLFSNCTEKKPVRVIERSFYYWKSSFNIDQSSASLLRGLHIKRLYVKFFDVAWNEQLNQPAPLTTIKFQQPLTNLGEMLIIPTVFITNECIAKMDSSQIGSTAEKIHKLIRQIGNLNSLPASLEIQLDCDWNATTKNKYFALLGSLKHLLSASKTRLSATIRLYQCKYAEKTGVPPVDRGLLMCYNMGNLKNPATINSILEGDELKKYLSGLSAYPLPLDLALPLFGWKVLFRNDRYKGLISELPTSVLEKSPAIRKTGNRYRVLYDAMLGGYDLKAGDVLRDEQVTYGAVTNAAELIASRLKTTHLAVSLYHLDSLTLSKYSIHELEAIFDHLR